MLCPICGKSVNNLSQVVSLCPSCQESQPKKDTINGLAEEPEVESTLVSKTFVHTAYDPAGFWLRVFATIIDGAVMYILSLIVSVGMLALIGGLLLMSPMIGMLFPVIVGFLAFFLTVFFVAFILPAVLEASKIQATLGKYLIGLRVINEDGSRIGIFKALLRSFIRFLSSVFLGIGFIPAGLTERKQAVHDIMCGTLVIKYKKVSPGIIFTYVLISLIITGIGSYISRDKKDHKKWQNNSSSVNILDNGPGLEILKESIENLEHSHRDKALPQMEIKATAPLNLTPSPISYPEKIFPAMKASPKPTPKTVSEESTLNEFERRLLTNKRLKESTGLK